MTVDQSEAVERYRLACSRLEAVRKAWEAEGSPMTAPAGRGGIAQHPLLKELRAHEHLVDRLYVHARAGKVGRPPAAVMDGEQLPPPRDELRQRRARR